MLKSLTSIGIASINSVESDLGWRSMIYFDNVTLALHKVTLTSQNHVSIITSVIAAKQTVINEVYVFCNKVFFNKISLFIAMFY